MKDKKEQGKFGEDYAVEYLVKHNYQIQERNVRIGNLEIDVVAQEKDTLVFIEIRLRNDATFGFPEDGMSKAKKLAIFRAGEAYLSRKPWTGDIRFDFISIVQKPELQLEHFKDIF
jgi:putative endonuclease